MNEALEIIFNSGCSIFWMNVAIYIFCSSVLSGQKTQAVKNTLCKKHFKRNKRSTGSLMQQLTLSNATQQ